MHLSELITSQKLTPAFTDEVVAVFRLGIQGIEVSQAVQYYEADDHLTDAADRGMNNGITLVANKPAWVRVYPWSAFGASGLTASLEVQRRRNGFLWTSVMTLNPDPSSANSVPASSTTTYAAMRGSLGASINFVIPAGEMIGTLRLIARIGTGSRSAESTVDVGVTLRQTLRLAGVMISYNGPTSINNAQNLQIAAPTLADLQAMAGTALTLFPVQSTAQFRAAGTLVQTNHLQRATFPTSGCGANWDALHAAVANARTADGNQAGWIYYGLLPNGVPMGPVGGCGGGGVAVGPINQPGTLAHEAGHACGLRHAPAGGAPNPDPNYPAYEPYDPANTPQASTGEYGLNVNNGNVASPATFRDFMSYAGPSWISPYHYGMLLNNNQLNPVGFGIDNPWWKDVWYEEIRRWPRFPEPDPPFQPPFELELPMTPPEEMHDVISVIARIDRGKVAEVLHVARTRAFTSIRGASATNLHVLLRSDDGGVLAEGALLRLDTAACSCEGGGAEGRPTSYLAQAFLLDVARGDLLEIANDDDEVQWRRDAPAQPPRVGAPDAKTDRRGNATIRWDASGDATEFWVRWSADGKSWRSLLTGVTTRKVRIDADQLPRGEGYLQVVAHDGFSSTPSDPTHVAFSDKPVDPVILHPVDGHTYTAGQAVRLWAAVVGDEQVGEATWLSGKAEVAHGVDTFVVLEPGEQTLTVRVPSGASASVRVRVDDHSRADG